MLLSFYHTCASKQHHDPHDRQSPMLSLSYTQWEFFIIELGLYIPMMGFVKMPEVFVSKQVGCTPTQFLLLSFPIFITLVHLLHGNPYSLTLISIDGHLHSPLIRLVDVRPSSSYASHGLINLRSSTRGKFATVLQTCALGGPTTSTRRRLCSRHHSSASVAWQSLLTHIDIS